MHNNKNDFSFKSKIKKGSLKLYVLLGVCLLIIISLFAVFKTSNSSKTKNVQDFQNKSNKELTSNNKTLEPTKKNSKVTNKTSMNKKQLNNKINKNNNISVFADEALKNDGKKIAFLTFDDGPSRNVTPKILDILKRYNVKATFFVLGQLADTNPDILKRIYKEGHSIANHSYSHDYNKIYKDIPSFMNEFNKSNESIKKIIGNDYKNELFRFPGGSFEKKKQPFKNKLKKLGFRYIDWNALNGDATGHNIPPKQLLKNIKSTTAGKKHVVILMHDSGTKKTTVEALPSIIEYLKSEGYEFRTLK